MADTTVGILRHPDQLQPATYCFVNALDIGLSGAIRRPEEKIPIRQFIALLMIVLTSGVGSNVALSAQEKRLTLQEQVSQIPSGAIVKAKLKTKETVQGRLGEVTSAGYTVQVTQAEKIENRQIAFDETKSIKQVEHHGKTGLWVGLGVLGGALAAIGIVVLAVASAD